MSAPGGFFGGGFFAGGFHGGGFWGATGATVTTSAGGAPGIYNVNFIRNGRAYRTHDDMARGEAKIERKRRTRALAVALVAIDEW